MDVSGYLGIATPVVRRLSARQYADLRSRPLDDVLAVCERLLKTRIYECKTVAFDWAYRRRSSVGPDHFGVYERWLRAYVDDWGDCDDFCVHALGHLVHEHPELVARTVAWSDAPEWWVRRAAAVVLIYGLRRGSFLSDAFGAADRLLEDRVDLVRKGYGWALKEAGKRWPDDVLDFVVERESEMPRVAFRYAIEKLPAPMRTRAMSGRPAGEP